MSRPVGTASPRRGRSLVLAASVLVGALAAAWSVVLPLGEGPDEPAHFGLVLHLADGNGYPDYDDLQRTVSLERLCTTFVASVRVCPLPGEAVTATAVRVRSAEGADDAPRPAWDDEGGADPASELNQMPQHPPLYYATMAAALSGARTISGGTMSMDRELALVRLLNALLVVPVPALALATVRRMGGSARSADGRGSASVRASDAAVLLVAGLPMLVATAGAVNNDNLLILLGAGLAPLLASLARGDRRRKTVVTAGAVVGLALLTKAFAVVFIPTLVAACWVGSRERGGDAPTIESIVGRAGRMLRVLSGLGAVVGLVAGWWYVRAWMRHGSPTPSADADRYTEALRPPGFTPDVVEFLQGFSSRLTQRFWGSFGWYSVRLPSILTIALTVGAALLLVAGLRRSPTAVARRSLLGVLVMPAALLVVLTALRAWSLHARSGQYPFIQGRYVLAGVVGLAAVAAIGWVRLVPARWTMPILCIVVVALQTGALIKGFTTYWADGLGGRLEALDAWSGLPGGLPVVLVFAAVVAMVGLLAVVAVDVVHGPPRPAPVDEVDQVGGPQAPSRTGSQLPSAAR